MEKDLDFGKTLLYEWQIIQNFGEENIYFCSYSVIIYVEVTHYNYPTCQGQGNFNEFPQHIMGKNKDHVIPIFWFISSLAATRGHYYPAKRQILTCFLQVLIGKNYTDCVLLSVAIVTSLKTMLRNFKLIGPCCSMFMHKNLPRSM